jgi:hypothetical protein
MSPKRVVKEKVAKRKESEAGGEMAAGRAFGPRRRSWCGIIGFGTRAATTIFSSRNSWVFRPASICL